MPTEAAVAETALRALAHPGKAITAAAYFKTGPGEYGEGDRFYGIRVPQVREVARQFNTLPLPACAELLQSPYNEARLMALPKPPRPRSARRRRRSWRP
mgnify:CR=1 FL=1